MNRLRVASYNIHGWEGTDRRIDPCRVMSVIDALDADIVSLQEVSSPLEPENCSLLEFAKTRGYHAAYGRTMQRPDCHYGNALLSRQVPMSVLRHDLDHLGGEPRGAMEAFFDFRGVTVRVLSTHLGLSGRERRAQVDTLDALLQNNAADITLVAGDLNEWRPGGRLGRRMRLLFGDTPAPRTFPSRWPVFSLDRIHVRPEHRLLSLAASKNALTRVASDHLPLLAEVDISPAP